MKISNNVAKALVTGNPSLTCTPRPPSGLENARINPEALDRFRPPSRLDNAKLNPDAPGLKDLFEGPYKLNPDARIQRAPPIVPCNFGSTDGFDTKR